MERVLAQVADTDEQTFVRNKLCWVGEAARNYKFVKEKLQGRQLGPF